MVSKTIQFKIKNTKLTSLEVKKLVERMPFVYEKLFETLTDKQKKETLQSIKMLNLDTIIEKWEGTL